MGLISVLGICPQQGVDGILWFNQVTRRCYIVFDSWLYEYPMAQLALRERLLARLRQAWRQKALGGMPVKVGFLGSLNDQELELYTNELAMPWNGRDWKYTQVTKSPLFEFIGRPPALPSPEENRRIGELSEVSSDKSCYELIK